MSKRLRDDMVVTRAMSKRMALNSSLPCFVRGCEFYGLRQNGFKCSEHCGLLPSRPKPTVCTDEHMIFVIENVPLGIKRSCVNWYLNVKKMISKQKSFLDAAKAMVNLVENELEVSLFGANEVREIMNFANSKFDGLGEPRENKVRLSHVLTRLCMTPWLLHDNNSPIMPESICYYGNFGEAPNFSPEGAVYYLTQWKNLRYDNARGQGAKWYL